MARIIGDISDVLNSAKFRYNYVSQGKQGEQLGTLERLLKDAEAVATSPAAVGLVESVRDAFATPPQGGGVTLEQAARARRNAFGNASQEEVVAPASKAPQTPQLQSKGLLGPSEAELNKLQSALGTDLASAEDDDPNMQEIRRLEASGMGGPQLEKLKKKLLWMKKNTPEIYARGSQQKRDIPSPGIEYEDDSNMLEIRKLESAGMGGPQLDILKRKLLWMKENTPDIYARGNAIEMSRDVPDEMIKGLLKEESAKSGGYSSGNAIELAQKLSDDVIARDEEIEKLEPKTRINYERAQLIIKNARRYKKDVVKKAQAFIKQIDASIDQQLAVRNVGEEEVASGSGGIYDEQANIPTADGEGIPVTLSRGKRTTQIGVQPREVSQPTPAPQSEEVVTPPSETPPPSAPPVTERVQTPWGAVARNAIDKRVAELEAKGGMLSDYEKVELAGLKSNLTPTLPSSAPTPSVPPVASAPQLQKKEVVAEETAAPQEFRSSDDVLAAARVADTYEKQQEVLAAASKFFRPKATNIFEAAGFGGISRSPDNVRIAREVAALFPKFKSESEKEKEMADIQAKIARTELARQQTLLAGAKTASEEAYRPGKIDEQIARNAKTRMDAYVAYQNAKARMMDAVRKGNKAGAKGAAGDADIRLKDYLKLVAGEVDQIEREIGQQTGTVTANEGKKREAETTLQDLQANEPHRGKTLEELEKERDKYKPGNRNYEYYNKQYAEKEGWSKQKSSMTSKLAGAIAEIKTANDGISALRNHKNEIVNQAKELIAGNKETKKAIVAKYGGKGKKAVTPTVPPTTPPAPKTPPKSTGGDKPIDLDKIESKGK